MKFKSILLTLTALLTLLTGFQVNAQSDEKKTLKVAVRVNAPFIMEKNGEYEGLAIDLWEEIAAELDRPYELYPLPLNGLLKEVENNNYDVGLGALTVTAEREASIDFSQPFHNGGLSVAVPTTDTSTWWAVTKRLVSFEFLKVVLVLAAVLFIAGGLVWFFERKENADEFSDDPAKGLGSGFWWAAVTMTTVGYGDKSPRSRGGRIVSLIWMFTGVIIISSFTASIASSLTVSQFQSKVSSVSDLPNAHVATLSNSATADWLDQQNIGYESFKDLNEALQKLDSGQLDAIVYDEPILRYSIRTGAYNNIRMLPERVLSQDYGFILPEGSQLREPLNRELLKVIQSPEWRNKLERYLGR